MRCRIRDEGYLGNPFWSANSRVCLKRNGDIPRNVSHYARARVLSTRSAGKGRGKRSGFDFVMGRY
jgi:hypothetical protein